MDHVSSLIFLKSYTPRGYLDISYAKEITRFIALSNGAQFQTCGIANATAILKGKVDSDMR